MTDSIMWNYSTSNPREHPTRRESNSVSTTPTTSEDSNPPFIHFIFLASILTPVALLPYLLTRRRLSTLNNTISELRSSNVRLQKEVKVAVRESIKHRIQVETLTEKTHVSLGRLILEMRKREVGRLIAEESMRKDLKELVLEKREMSKTQAETLRDLGMSLADIAAFMQEVEIKHGFVPKKDDGRGIERIRQMALRLQRIMKGEETPILSEEMKTGEPEGNASVKEQETQTDSKSSDKT